MIEELLTPYICPRFLSDEHYREWSVGILAPKPGTRVLGLHTPEIKMLAKEFVKSGKWTELCKEFCKRVPKHDGELQELCQEERTIWGLMLDYAKVDASTRFALIKDFLPAIDNWAICDTFCCNSKWIEKENKDNVWGFIGELYAVNPEDKDYEFTLRVAIVLSMCHFLDDASLQRTFAKIESLHLQEGSPYYVRMGIAWLLATALAKHETQTRDFVRNSSLPEDIKKLYVRKAKESRITKNTKAL